MANHFAVKNSTRTVLNSNGLLLSLSGIRMTDFATLRHFGGSLQNRDDLPKNYVAVAMVCM